ncbi:hypothetical protein NM208_g15695 [Fusarium decemcellulare]|uniref:Uncharacterized protein n=1 Tax=Fusarium decemcellulare TaxID=57161 RepID=A0ACC1RCA7_9HYPO|nr:hypothetical protein NM208_g15695 [Fusarium decemcellulare]
MEWIDYFPYPCELSELVRLAIAACDELDGVKDGIISDDSACDFDPLSVVGMSFTCSNTNTTEVVSREAAMIAKATWSNITGVDGHFLWYGANIGSQLSGSTTQLTNDIGPAMTSCSSNGTCVGVPLGLGETWIKYFLEADPRWDYSSMTKEEFENKHRESTKRYDDIIGTNNPDLAAFYNRGGKILGYHGMADQIIPVKGSEHYYDRVAEIIPQVDEFYRMFEVPGLFHCSGGPGGQPINTFDALRAWVENGTEPDTLVHKYTPVSGGPELSRLLCPYPKKPVPKMGSNAMIHSSFHAEAHTCV